MTQVKQYPSILKVERPFSTDPDNFAIEKIGNRVKKDVRTATFGVMQYLDGANRDIGRLRARAQSQIRHDTYENKKLLISGDSGIYPKIPALEQRNVRQMRNFKPGARNKPEEFK